MLYLCAHVGKDIAETFMRPVTCYLSHFDLVFNLDCVVSKMVVVPGTKTVMIDAYHFRVPTDIRRLNSPVNSHKMHA